MPKLAKYYIYRNLNTNSFSIKYKGIVIERPIAIKLMNVDFIVSEKGRLRVLKEKRKNVHATLATSKYEILKIDKISDEYEEVYYNPYKTSFFILKRNNKKITKKDEVICLNNKIYIKN
jgi:hypothetical protein